uniref:Bulb-type lectin domain-containing protein n=1 Tax=Oncorhynchus tshawytscha TaxID=74940 RepID=A0AAZ3R0J3_ONCTS
MSRNYMSKYDEMRKGEVQQQRVEGLMVSLIYGWKPMWNSDNAGRRDAHRLCMQDDCNFAMYKRDEKRGTNTQANGFNTCRMWLRNNDNLVIEKDGEEVWNSAQSKGSK